MVVSGSIRYGYVVLCGVVGTGNCGGDREYVRRLASASGVAGRDEALRNVSALILTFHLLTSSFSCLFSS